MAKTKSKQERRQRVHRGIRNTIQGTSVRPRLSVYRSNQHTYAQLIDDFEGHTIVAASTQEPDIEGDNPTEQSRTVGALIAKRANEAGVENAVFDRSGYRYHGRVKAVAEGARDGGLHL